MVPIRGMVIGLALSVLVIACGATDAVVVESLAGGSAGEALSSCEPAGDQQATRLVEATGELPSVAVMEEAMAVNSDAEFWSSSVRMRAWHGTRPRVGSRTLLRPR